MLVQSDYTAIFEASPDALLVVDSEGVIRDLNRQALAMFGWSREEMVGFPVERLVPAASRSRHRRYRRRYGESPYPRTMKRLALPAMDAAVWDALKKGAPGVEPRIWVRESSYRAGSWSRSRRVVQVVVERPGELMTVVSPALSSASRCKSPYRGRKIAEREKGVDPFACN